MVHNKEIATVFGLIANRRLYNLIIAQVIKISNLIQFYLKLKYKFFLMLKELLCINFGKFPANFFSLQ